MSRRNDPAQPARGASERWGFAADDLGEPGQVLRDTALASGMLVLLLVLALAFFTGCSGPNVQLTADYAERMRARNEGIAAVTTGNPEAHALAKANASWWAQVRPALLDKGEIGGAK